VVENVNAKRIEGIVALIRQRLADNAFPYQIREVGGGYVLSTLPEYAPWLRKFYAPKVKASKLSQAALETLAVVAYKQPVTRGEVEAIRGVNVDSTLKTLLEKRLVEIVGYKDVVGKPATYGTTSEFLLQFGLKSLNELPSIEELRRMNAGQ
jgi:segregation and condensation protein B